MRGYIFLCIILTTLFTFAQPNTIKPSDSIMIKSEAEKLVLKEQKTIDSLRILREKERTKQDSMLKIISNIKKAKENLKSVPDTYSKKSKDYKNNANINGIKPNDSAEYWEEITQRSWFGRQITGQQVKIRKYTYEKGIKVYKN